MAALSRWRPDKWPSTSHLALYPQAAQHNSELARDAYAGADRSFYFRRRRTPKRRIAQIDPGHRARTTFRPQRPYALVVQSRCLAQKPFLEYRPFGCESVFRP